MQMIELPSKERWFQRLMTAALVALAASLVGLGLLLYV
jgi:hypothetical protein